MIWSHEIDTWIVIIGALCAASCALLGCFLVLRHMSMMGDAISHAVLPGLAAAFLLTESRASLAMFIGAAIVGVLTAVLVQWVHTFGKVDRGAAMGVVFTTLFAIGLIMIVRAADHVDLDPDCVLYGAVELAPMYTTDGFSVNYDSFDVLGMQAPMLRLVESDWGLGVSIPVASLTLSALLMVICVFILVFYKELKITSFDPALASSLGINANVMHYALMALVAVTTVASFEIIGSILVIAMLIVPAAAAHLLTERLPMMLIISVVIAVLSAGLGHLAAIGIPPMFGYTDTSTAGMMATIAGVLFVVVLFLAPRHGIVSKALHRFTLRLRIISEDLLGLVYRHEESASRDMALNIRAAAEALGTSPWLVRLAMHRLRRRGRMRRPHGVVQLTDPGRREAAHLVRSHRLWESYLHEHVGVAADHVHGTAHRVEHITTPAMQRKLDEATDEPSRDPHGRRVPPARGDETQE